jgi:hypothetical protein
VEFAKVLENNIENDSKVMLYQQGCGQQTATLLIFTK